MTTLVNRADYDAACDAYDGWCPACEAFSRPCTEPDITPESGYTCDACDGLVYGAEQALLEGVIELDGEDED